MMINYRTRSAYVVNSASDSISRIDLDDPHVVEEIAVGRGPVGVNVSADERRIYAGNRAEGTVSVVGASDHREWSRIPVGEAPAGFAVDAATGYLLVSNAGSNTVSVVEDLVSGPRAELAPAVPHPLVGQPLPPFALPDLRTESLRHSREWAERKYILHFFASW
jgi:YVTN family beta-propeller protein